MTNIKSYKRDFAEVMRFWDGERYDQAFDAVEAMREIWPGNARLNVVSASLAQLQDDPTISLDDVKKRLQTAIDLDPTSPAPSIELGHFLLDVEDSPVTASRAFEAAIGQARRLLIEALAGQAKTFLELGKRNDAIECLREVLRLAKDEPQSKEDGGSEGDIVLRDALGRTLHLPLRRSDSEGIQELIDLVFASSTDVARR